MYDKDNDIKFTVDVFNIASCDGEATKELANYFVNPTISIVDEESANEAVFLDEMDP